jgi:hypothetical protein
VTEEEIRRLVGALGAGEVWERRGDRWLLQTGHARAIVSPRVRGDPGGHCAWGVKLLRGGRLIVGTAESEHEAMRSAERVIEEHRP